jgi:restriction system protein
VAKNRKRSANPNFADDIIKITSELPWWAGVVSAGVSFLIMRWLATGEVARVANVRDVAGMVGMQIVYVLATVGQFVLPLLFLAGALHSYVSSKKQTMALRVELPAAGGGRAVPVRREPSLAPANIDRVSDAFADTLSHEPRRETAQSEAGRARPAKLNLELLRAMDWRRFEEVCAEYFRLCGFHAATQSHGADGGIDIRLYAQNDHSKVVNIVQCKKWGKPVGPKALRELLGVMAANKFRRGIFVASSTFNDEATQFAEVNKIHLINGAAFIDKVLARPAADQQRLLDVATEGDYLTPSCPSCGIKLISRENKKSQSRFWGCMNFPRCRYTLQG